MPVKLHKPTSPGRRFRSDLVKDEITKQEPEKSLTRPLKKKAGRARGKITVRHRGGGHKRKYRLIDFKRHDRVGDPAKVLAIEYDPNRSANIALVEYQDSERRYILAPQGLRVGQEIVANEQVPIKVGNAAPLRNLPLATEVHNIELLPGGGGQLVRAAGRSAVLQAKEGKFAQLKLPSGEVRLVLQDCWATIGRVGNEDHHSVVIGKAGRKRHLGWRPKVRGTAMPAGEHPHGGGEGRTGTGRIPRTYKGKKFKGIRTRPKAKPSNKYIVKPRKA